MKKENKTSRTTNVKSIIVSYPLPSQRPRPTYCSIFGSRHFPTGSRGRTRHDVSQHLKIGCSASVSRCKFPRSSEKMAVSGLVCSSTSGYSTFEMSGYTLKRQDCATRQV